MINKKTVCAVLCALLTVSAAGCKDKNTLSQTSDSGTHVNSAVESIRTIDVEEAKSIALQNAGLSEDDVIFVKTKIERDNGRDEYDIEFTSGGVKYEYEIDTESGNILKFSSKLISESRTDTGVSLSGESSEQISLEEAKSIALQHAGSSENDVIFVKTKLERDNGRVEYDIEFTSGGVKYEYEIDAKSGNVLEFSSESIPEIRTDTDVSSSGESSEQITLDEAKTAALEHAGFDADQVIFTKTELDYDDGTAEYEIEFKANGLEYEYTINAFTGKIIEYDIDD